MRMVKDLSVRTLLEIRRAREDGATWMGLEDRFNLKPTRGMTAYNAVLRLNRLERAIPAKELLKDALGKGIHYCVIRLKNARGMERELFEWISWGMRDAGMPLDEMARALKRLVDEAPPELKPFGLREIWNIGMRADEFENLCAAHPSGKIWKYEAANRLFGSLIGDDAAKNAATKYLDERLPYLPGCTDGTEALNSREGQVQGPKGRKICIPKLYFPNKDPETIAAIRRYKFGVTGGRCDIGE